MNKRIEYFVTPPTSKIAKKYADSYCKNVIFNVWYLLKYPADVRKCYYATRVLLDSGVNQVFEVKGLDDYPKWYLENYFYFVMGLSLIHI